jgi:hypothetical protein
MGEAFLLVHALTVSERGGSREGGRDLASLRDFKPPLVACIRERADILIRVGNEVPVRGVIWPTPSSPSSPEGRQSDAPEAHRPGQAVARPQVTKAPVRLPG